MPGIDDNAVARYDGGSHAVAVGLDYQKPLWRSVQLLAHEAHRKHPGLGPYGIGVAAIFANLPLRCAAAGIGAGIEFRHLTERLVARFTRFSLASAGIAPPKQHLLRRIAEMLGKGLEVIEPHPDLAALEPRQLLLGDP